tara:strand:+ start:1739 stop:1900 length:162 start_codon:yes stop_codon:yes gene_type:complete
MIKEKKAIMIEDIEIIIKANKDNPYCSVFCLADMIKQIVTNPDLEEIEEINNG